MSDNPQQPQEPQEKDTIVEEFEMAGSELVGRVRQLIEEGNVRRLVIRNAEDEVLFVVPLTASMIAGGAMLVFTPILAAIGAAAAFLTRVKLQVIRIDDKTKNDDSADHRNDKTKIDID
ncbi:MAG: DUF4342 domain-containing protein [Anaerolineae bacterium]